MLPFLRAELLWGNCCPARNGTSPLFARRWGPMTEFWPVESGHKLHTPLWCLVRQHQLWDPYSEDDGASVTLGP